jgi:hypothetical protein
MKGRVCVTCQKEWHLLSVLLQSTGGDAIKEVRDLEICNKIWSSLEQQDERQRKGEIWISSQITRKR